jgi:hypothetical protein
LFQADKTTAEIMSNIVKHENSFSDIMTIGKAFAESGMFADVKSAAQAVVKITAGAEMGIPPFASMSGIHIIQGKPTIGAGLLAARVKASGKYSFTVVKLDDKIASIDFTEDGKVIGNSTFTIEDAKKAGTGTAGGKDLIGKYPKNMLFARAMSNGVKWYTPDLFAGPVYVPGEIEPDPVQDIPHEEVKDTPEAISHAIATLHLCTNEQELKDWKATTPEIVVKNKAVSAAATAKYKEVTGGK